MAPPLNKKKVPGEIYISHGWGKFVELLESYPQECRFVIETLAEVYKYDEE
jgi:hypothetical protein